MGSFQQSKMVRIYLSEKDRFDGKPLYEAVVDRCRVLKIAGATVFRGAEGFGETAEVHRAHVLTHDLPVMITIVDTNENIERLLPEIEEMMENGLVVSSDVVMRRVNRSSAVH
jgi:PII-like signaling protein